ncbi:MAG TPA: glycosyltransferase family 9 protein [Sandaracinaceae bacterium]
MNAKPHDEARIRDWSSVRRLLAVRLDAMGDVLMTTPALNAAKTSCSGRHVTLLTSAGGAQAARLLPDVDDVIVYDAPWVKATANRAHAEFDRQMIRRLARGGFDAAVIFTVYSQNPLPAAMLCYLADIPRRLAHCREHPYQLLTDWIPEREPEGGVRHEVERQLDLVAAVGWRARDRRMRIVVPNAAAIRIAERLAALGLGADTRWAVLHPGASAPSRRYPPERFGAVVRTLASQHGWRFVLTGSRDEIPLAERVRAEAPAETCSLAGELGLAELAALIRRAPLLISNNTGPVHIAAAVGTPVVDLYALTNPQHTPWLVPSRVLFREVPCAPCYRSVCPERHHLCLAGVTPEQVVEAALELVRVEDRESGLRSGTDHPEPPTPVRRRDIGAERSLGARTAP